MSDATQEKPLVGCDQSEDKGPAVEGIAHPGMSDAPPGPSDGPKTPRARMSASPQQNQGLKRTARKTVNKRQKLDFSESPTKDMSNITFNYGEIAHLLERIDHRGRTAGGSGLTVSTKQKARKSAGSLTLNKVKQEEYPNTTGDTAQGDAGGDADVHAGKRKLTLTSDGSEAQMAKRKREERHAESLQSGFVRRDSSDSQGQPTPDGATSSSKHSVIADLLTTPRHNGASHGNSLATASSPAMASPTSPSGMNFSSLSSQTASIPGGNHGDTLSKAISLSGDKKVKGLPSGWGMLVDDSIPVERNPAPLNKLLLTRKLLATDEDAMRASHLDSRRSVRLKTKYGPDLSKFKQSLESEDFEKDFDGLPVMSYQQWKEQFSDPEEEEDEEEEEDDVIMSEMDSILEYRDIDFDEEAVIPAKAAALKAEKNQIFLERNKKASGRHLERRGEVPAADADDGCSRSFTGTPVSIDFTTHGDNVAQTRDFKRLLNKIRLNEPKEASIPRSKVDVTMDIWFHDEHKRPIRPKAGYINTPDGLSYPVMTPPGTPETTSETEALNFIPLCACRVSGAHFANASHVTYCQALDTVDGKVIGCCNKVAMPPQLLRPSVKIPFMVMCELHKARMKRHQCCPGCGYFCSQGQFYQCQPASTNIIHIYHKECQVIRDDHSYCPHCGEESEKIGCDLRIKLPISSENRTTVFDKLSNRKPQPRARMGLATQNGTIEECSGMPFPLPPPKVGLQTKDLTKIMDALKEEKLNELLANKKALPRHLYNPSKKGDIEKVVAMLVNGTKPNRKHEENMGQTALHAAAQFGHVLIAQCLVQAGANVDCVDKDLKTPAMLAAESNCLEIINYLSKAGAQLDLKDRDGMTCIQLAARAGHLEIVKYLLATAGVNINLQDDGGWTALVWAAEHRHLKVVQHLLACGADCNLRDNEQNIGLHWAAYSGSVDIAEMFINAGSDYESINEHGDRPLHVAARQGHYESVVLLLARGADCDARNNERESPYMVCVDKESPTAMALQINKKLRSLRTDVGPRDRLLHRDLSCGKENNPITCVNNVDDENYPTDYHYVNDNCETMILNMNKLISGLQHCGCADDCSSLFCVCSRNSVKCWFDKEGLLLPDFNLAEPPLIFECNKRCRCWMTCNNRVIQNGITCRLEVFKTRGEGWGVRPLLDIRKGSFICEYIGELISDAEADRRQDDSYLFDLDNRDVETYCIDARRYGNVARFINHACEPNLIPVKVFVDHQDLRFPRICFFASRDIQAGEELGFDYGEKFWIIKWKEFTCACGSEKCKYSSEMIHKTIEAYNQKQAEEEQNSSPS